MTPIILFYIYGGTDNDGRTLKDYRNMSLDDMEKSHSYIQWMFPLNEPSSFNVNAPICTKEDCENELIKPRILNSLNQFKIFLNHNPQIFEDAFNHNALRISRVIKCLRLFGFHEEAKKFFTFVLNKSNQDILFQTIPHWEEALEKELWI